MIIVKLQGGLGNQMFQYACGRAVSLKHNVPMYLDISGFPDHNGRKYRLDEFNIKAEIAGDSLINRMKYRKIGFSDLIKHKLFSSHPEKIPSDRYFKEKEKFCYDENIFKYSGDLYLDGSWQSEKYFSDIDDIIRDDFKFRTQLSYYASKFIEIIDGCNSVSIHVRRGDYITNINTNKFHGVLPVQYYMSAMKMISEKTHEPHFFVFSDEISWAKNNIVTRYPVSFYENNVSADCEELTIMSKCKHHIIANSSFSWWGAWLCENREKIVAAPEKWLNGPEINASQILPEKWFKI